MNQPTMTGLGEQGREGLPPFYRSNVEPWNEIRRKNYTMFFFNSWQRISDTM